MAFAIPASSTAHLRLTRSNVSNHLSCLRGCGLVVATLRAGRFGMQRPTVTWREPWARSGQVVLAVDTDQPTERAASRRRSRSTGMSNRRHDLVARTNKENGTWLHELLVKAAGTVLTGLVGESAYENFAGAGTVPWASVTLGPARNPARRRRQGRPMTIVARLAGASVRVRPCRSARVDE